MEGCVRGDHTAGTSTAVSVLWGSDELRLLALLELADTFVPSSDDLTNADLELEGLATLHRGIENFTIGEGSVVVHLDEGSFGHSGASAFVLLNNLH